jgi:hypothetical protein
MWPFSESNAAAKRVSDAAQPSIAVANHLRKAGRDDDVSTRPATIMAGWQIVFASSSMKHLCNIREKREPSIVALSHC